jgi:hypothetical protein
MGIFSREPKEHVSAAPEPIGAIVAGGQSYSVSSYSDATNLTLLRQTWQQRAFDLYETEGHLYYATNYVGSTLARIKLVAAELPETDESLSKPRIIESGPVADAVRNIKSARGGQRGLLRQVARNVFLTGEAWIIAETDPLTGKQTWDAVSISELQTHGQTTSFSRRRLPGQQPVPLPRNTLAMRIWKESPQYSELADSGVRSVIEILEKIVVLNRAEKAVARSRLAGSGILALPQELVPPAWQNQGDSSNQMEANPLWQALAESMTAPLEDESHPSAVVPLLLIGPGETINKIKYEPLNRDFDTAGAQESIQNGIQQIASALELPREILLGVGETTSHFTAWAIREDTFMAHIQPLIELICDAMTRTYLHAALAKLTPEQLAESGITDPSRLVVWYDASEIIIKPDKSDKAIALHDRIVISDKALREEHGFGEGTAPGESEYTKRLGIKTANPEMAVTGELPEYEDIPLPTPSARSVTAPKL